MRGSSSQGHDIAAEGRIGDRDSATNVGRAAAATAVSVAVTDAAAVPARVVTIAGHARVVVGDVATSATGEYEQCLPGRHRDRGLHTATKSTCTCIRCGATFTALGIDGQPCHARWNRIRLRCTGVVEVRRGGEANQNRDLSAGIGEATGGA